LLTNLLFFSLLVILGFINENHTMQTCNQHVVRLLRYPPTAEAYTTSDTKPEVHSQGHR